MHLYGLYKITKLNNEEVRITPKGKNAKTYKYTAFEQDGENLELTLRHIKCYFELDHAENRYCLLEIENLRKKKDEVIPHFVEVKRKTRAESMLEQRKQNIIDHFNTHLDQVGEVLRFCRIEGAVSFDNVRFEISRIMHYDGVYMVSEDVLREILKRYGFVVKEPQP